MSNQQLRARRFPLISKGEICMVVTISFYSYFKELTGSSEIVETLPEGSTLQDLFNRLGLRFPKLEAMQKSTLMAVGLNYQPHTYVLREGDQVSLFPPVQGG
jgi:molybdopterin converting factor small subunit